jgi:hypothetical protein
MSQGKFFFFILNRAIRAISRVWQLNEISESSPWHNTSINVTPPTFVPVYEKLKILEDVFGESPVCCRACNSGCSYACFRREAKAARVFDIAGPWPPFTMSLWAKLHK